MSLSSPVNLLIRGRAISPLWKELGHCLLLPFLPDGVILNLCAPIRFSSNRIRHQNVAPLNFREGPICVPKQALANENK
jgi:hypothetical protein